MNAFESSKSSILSSFLIVQTMEHVTTVPALDSAGIFVF